MTLEVLTAWRETAAKAADEKADALEEALVTLDAVLPLIRSERHTDVRALEATLRDAIREYREDAAEAREDL